MADKEPQHGRPVDDDFLKSVGDDFPTEAEHDDIVAALESLCHPEPDEKQSWQELRARLDGRRHVALWRRLAPVVAGVAAVAAIVVLLAWPLLRPRHDASLAVAPTAMPGRQTATNAPAAPTVAKPTMTPSAGVQTDEAVALDTFRTGIAESLNVDLPDGSTVWLGARSTLVCPHAFAGATRSVTLSVEGYFHVRHDASHPFLVQAGMLTTRVLGTTFYISAYEGDKPSVTLVEGRVAVTSQGARAVLSAGQEASWQGGRLDVQTVDTYPCTQWARGYFYFNDTPMLDIMGAIARWYHKTVVFENDAAMHVRLHFVASRKESLQRIAAQLNEQDGVLVELRGGEIVVR